MLNRTIQVKMVKNDKNEPTEPDLTDKHFEDKTALIGYHFEKLVEKIGIAVMAFVVADTIRQVVVAKASK